MLRNRAVVSSLEDFTPGKFREVIDDPRLRDQNGPAVGVTKLLLCSGKIYWELAAARDKLKIDDTAIVRIEQLYPLPHRQLAAVLERYPNAADVRCPGSRGSPAGAWQRPRRARRRSTRSSRRRSSTRRWVCSHALRDQTRRTDADAAACPFCRRCAG
jgi:2-oxoglutarate dehydrogenase complex dehydrogenase (E1) component-like enzyme